MIQVSWCDHFVSDIFLRQIKNLEDPYETKCADKKLKAFSSYTIQGCSYECLAEQIMKSCNCRAAGYSGLGALSFLFLVTKPFTRIPAFLPLPANTPLPHREADGKMTTNTITVVLLFANSVCLYISSIYKVRY